MATTTVSRRLTLTACIWIGAVAGVAHVVRWIQSATVGRAGQFVDDGYYYFGIARHVVDGAGSTFGGLDHTNGYHPMWLIVLLPIFAALHNRYHALLGVKILSAMLWVIALREVSALSAKANARAAFAIGLVPTSLYVAFAPRSLPFAGVETGLVLVALLAAIRVLVDPTTGRRSNRFLAVLFAFAVASRLDAVFCVTAFAFYAASRPGEESDGTLSTRVRAAIFLLIPSGMIVVVQALVNRIWFGELITVSTRSKSLADPGSRHVALSDYFFDPRSLPTFVGIGTVSLVAVVVAFLVALSRRKNAHGQVIYRLAQCLVMLWSTEFVSTAIFDSQSSWPQWPWYFFGSFIVLMLAPGIVIAALLPDLDSWFAQRTARLRSLQSGGSRSRSNRSLPAATALITAVVLGVGIGVATKQSGEINTFYDQNAAAISKLDGVLPSDAVIAMGDRAGVIGYFLDRPMVQLEGIVNSNEYLDTLEDDSVAQWLRDRNVTYYAKSSHLPDRYPLEVGGEPEGNSPECGPRFEPFFGVGNKVQITVCRADIVFASPIVNGEQLVVWRITKPITTFRVK